MRSDWRKAFLAAFGCVAGVAAFGRGERWINPPQPAPAVSTLTNEARYVEWKWRTDVTDPATGIGNKAVTKEAEALVSELEPKEPWRVVKAKAYQLICDRMSIGVSDLDWFPAFACYNRYDLPLKLIVWRREKAIDAKIHPKEAARIREGNLSGEWSAGKDFCHSVPQWDQVLALGLPGLRRRVAAYGRKTPFYESLEITADASIRLIGRLAAQAEKVAASGGGPRARRQAEALRQLERGAPRTAYEAMQLIYLYFVFSEHIDFMQCRSLSVIDQTLWPYYRADLAAGRTTEAEFREQFLHFLWQWGSIDNYWGQPVTVGGTGMDGKTACNPLTKIVLEVADAYGQPTPKFHLKTNFNLPDDILNLALDMARRQRSISFCGEEPMWKVMTSYGISEEDAHRCITKGCYEFCPPDGANATDMGMVSYVKPLERILADSATNAFEAATYAAFEREYLKRMTGTFAELLGIVSVMERYLEDVNPSGMGSLGVENSVRTGRDALANGAAKGNNTGVETVGFGTAVDVLMAVREIVYERKEMSLADLGKLMAANWAGREDLRLRMQRSKRKWGANDPDANATAQRLSKAVAGVVNHKPNARGGQYLLSGHSARGFVTLGAKTGATPDGRRAGEEFSKNLSPTMGADTEGVTALVHSLGAIASTDFPYDFPLDVMLLPSTVEGEKGLEMMKALLKVYYANDGVMMQFNVFSPELLRDAQAHPEKFANLMVRVCGWSVRWNDLPKVEQDAYIRRAECILQ